jgi:hypothetical protein
VPKRSMRSRIARSGRSSKDNAFMDRFRRAACTDGAFWVEENVGLQARQRIRRLRDWLGNGPKRAGPSGQQANWPGVRSPAGFRAVTRTSDGRSYDDVMRRLPGCVLRRSALYPKTRDSGKGRIVPDTPQPPCCCRCVTWAGRGPIAAGCAGRRPGQP